ncbi:Gfo/Idh/MocA family protein [Convivina praedatoris]|uniref:Scyllo-inositol 2-dehydrogenase (NADP(+)) IolU n=1 Tax=Convivina praedatoris TaxID=2880963 RepID=A0ABM9D026_9LACO|nr:Gfo/Idh/MocA family oxidoreductase [Convivina sp. LMG 32447]CAH1850345.1 scyllo-inositol 2-dehydrogenase (NADP(+)) IolU [Convivina sp. LMG 32447]CAH1850845.1 scyllo-inositol 2-dehydrogenase (NADP(+)) IolU [Convivina sp. LMG 32447]CAH1850859.1 scyllo-inositol 2-dehydrogenase (NADP(+)) IolU [Convivina sp. LMG 32447]
MLRLGTIGTSWIVKQFIEAIHLAGAFDLGAVYSRRINRAEEFLAELTPVNSSVLALDSLTELFEASDLVYIASPNSLHFEQAEAALKAGCHVIVEKPAFSNPREFAQIQELLGQHPDLMLMEANRHLYQPNFIALQKAVAQLPQIDGANFVMAQYSSKYDAYLAGENPNVFNKNFSAGALYDLGVYPLSAALALFGQPQAVQYLPVLLDNQTDGSGQATLIYPGYQVNLQFSKTYNAYRPSEIYAGRQTVSIDHIADLNHIHIMKDGQSQTAIAKPQAENPMVAEVQNFAHWLANPQAYYQQYQQALQLSQLINQTLFDLRQSAQIEFPADERVYDN